MGQTSVSNTYLGTGLVGEFYSTEPQSARTLILASASAALNVVGSVVTFVDAQDDQAGIAASSNFAGIIGMPKVLAREGLDAATSIANGVPVEILDGGYIFVDLPAAAGKGDFVYYSNTDGTLATVAPDGVPPAGHTRVPGGIVSIKNVTEAGLGIIYVERGGDISDSTGI
jgi:hypothetical protein